MIKVPLSLEHIGESKYIRVLYNYHNNEKPDIWLIDAVEEMPKISSAAAPIMPIYWKCAKEVAKKYSIYDRYFWYQLEDDWRERLITCLSKYQNTEDVDIEDVLSSVYKKVCSAMSHNVEMRITVNGDKHMLDMNELILKVIKPIEDINGDVYYLYNYKDQYVVIREFMYNKIYVLDFFSKKIRTEFIDLMQIEKRICSFHYHNIIVGSQMYETSLVSDKPRIDILLNPDSTEAERKKAKG